MPGPQLDAPPASSPDVTSQMGMSGVTQAFGESLKGQQTPPDLAQAGKDNPQGFLKTQYDAIEKVVQQMASQSRAFAPFAMKGLAILKQGIAQAMSAPPDAAGGGKDTDSDLQSPAVGSGGGSGYEGHDSGAGANFVG